MNPFSEISARDWAAKRTVSPAGSFPPLLLLGRGPFDPEELAQFFANHDITAFTRSNVFSNDGEVPQEWSCLTFFSRPVVVLGRFPSKQDALATLLRSDESLCPKFAPDVLLAGAGFWFERSNQNGLAVFRRSRSLEKLQFVSQEYAVAHFICGAQIGKNDRAWDTHEHNHEVIQMLPDMLKQSLAREPDFIWPSTEALGGDGSAEIDSPDLGYLRQQGYRVGKNGKPEKLRRHILEDCFRDPFLKGLDPDYRQEWAEAFSAARLKKMAYSIAAFARNAKRKDHYQLAQAIADWEADLAWLKRVIYDGRFDGQFRWPSTDKD